MFKVGDTVSIQNRKRHFLVLSLNEKEQKLHVKDRSQFYMAGMARGKIFIKMKDAVIEKNANVY